jgi:hypothetical protein
VNPSGEQYQKEMDVVFQLCEQLNTATSKSWF